LGIDNEEPAIENANENSLLNGVADIHWSLDDIEIIKEKEFDIILANINRNVLLKYLSYLHSMLKLDGMLVLSGILSTDESLMITALSKTGFIPGEIRRRGEWVCISAQLT
jgi:ribosomal protein L11 methyltransferase